MKEGGVMVLVLTICFLCITGKGALWLTGIVGSIAYNWSKPKMKTSVKIIHARLNAQALTLAAIAGGAVVEYYDQKSGEKANKYAKYMHVENFQHKD